MKVSSILVGLAAYSCMTVQPVHAEDLKGVWFVGGTVGEGQSAYGGAVVALPGDRLGSGFALRGTATAGNYNYISNGQEISGDYVGGELALVYQTSGPWGWANFSAGPRVTNTKLNPIDPTNKRQGTRADLGLQSDGALDSSKWRASWQVSYALVDQAYQAQVRIARKLGTSGFRLGAEGGVLGDPSFDRVNLGLHAALPVSRRIEMQIGSGVTSQKGKSGKVYGSVGLSSVF